MRRLLLAPVAAALVLATPLGAQAKPPAVKPSKPVCPGPAAAGSVRCHARVVTQPDGVTPAATATPAGLGPADLQSAYALTASSASAGATQTIGIVDAYDDPNAASDLATYRSTYGLPACPTTNGCLRKVNQDGGTKAPKANGGWAQEISLDLDMASAICPNCRILLVEARSSSLADLGAAENTAVRLGATVVSNSYGGSELSQETSSTYDGPYDHPGVPITVSSGDSGYGVQFPAASPHVTAVGGTSLRRDAGTARGWGETAWSGAGSGCSAYAPKPSWQTDTGCANRTVADVSADADPSTGVAVYDSYRYQGAGGWMAFGGTSAAAPVVAGTYALAGNGTATTYGSSPYAHLDALFDVLSGSNGTCSPGYLCTAGTGFDGPSGLGTPNGTGGF